MMSEPTPHPMTVEFHLLQNFSPSCLNRDDTNTPKSCIFGGVRRARVSSQCLKRAMRLHMRDRYGIPTGTRTRLLAKVIADRLKATGKDEAEALARARKALERSGFKLTAGEDEGRIQVGLYLAAGEIDRLADAVAADWDALAASPSSDPADASATPRGRGKKKGDTGPELTNVKDAIAAIERTVDASDIALFGRMVAEATHMKVDAASQVAHALSTHACEVEMDYFTAVDDEQPEADPGAGMLGLVGYQSACFYRYALVHRDQLAENLGGNRAQANKTIAAFLRSAVEAIPTGRQNGSAAHNWPDYVAIRVGARLPLNLANAFERPIRPSRSSSLVDESANRLVSYRDRVQSVYGADGEWFACSTVEGIPGDGSLSEMESWLTTRLEAA